MRAGGAATTAAHAQPLEKERNAKSHNDGHQLFKFATCGVFSHVVSC